MVIPKRRLPAYLTGVWHSLIDLSCRLSSSQDNMDAEPRLGGDTISGRGEMLTLLSLPNDCMFDIYHGITYSRALYSALLIASLKLFRL